MTWLAVAITAEILLTLTAIAAVITGAAKGRPGIGACAAFTCMAMACILGIATTAR